MKKLIILLIIIAVIGGVTFVAVKDSGPKGVNVVTEKARRGDITSIVTATGKVFPETEVSISSEVSGEIIELNVVDGQEVHKGELLSRVNPQILEAQVLQQEAALRASEANSHEAEARMAQTALNLRRTESLFAKGFATQDQVDDAKTAHEVATASHAATQSRIEQQQMQLKEARDLLAKAALYAPIDGTITALNSELGDRVVGTGQFAGTEIMRVANLDNMEVRVDVSEADIVAVRIGQPAEVEIDAIPDQVFAGEVTEIANSADTSQQRTQDQLTTFRVKVRLLEPTSEIRPGMTATAEIKTETVTDVVKVPLQAVTVRAKDVVRQQLDEEPPTEDEEGSPPPIATDDEERPGSNASRRRDNLERVMFVVRDGKAQLVRVETGIADNRWLEIKSGIAEGDEIVTGSYRVLSRELSHDAAVIVSKKAEKKSWKASDAGNTEG